MQNLYNVGDIKIKKLIEKNINEKNIKDNFNVLDKSTRLMLIYNVNIKIPHNDIKNIIQNYFLPKNKFIITGSWRRKKQFSSDIDILFFSKQVLNNLKKHNYNWIELSSGEKKISGIFLYEKYPVKIDLWYVSNRDEVPFMLLYSTGSKINNIHMRKKAKILGMKLTQYGLFDKNNNKIKVKNEKQIYEKLNIKYKIPEDR